MARQLRGKFIKSDAIDGSKIKLLQGQSIRGTDSQGNEVELVKLGSQGEALVNGVEAASKSALDQEILDRQSGDSSTLQSGKDYADAQIVIEATARDAAISVAVMAEQQARELFDGMFDSRLTQEVSDRQAGDEALSGTISSTAASLMGTIGAVVEMLNQEVLDRQSGDTSTLQAGKDYTDAQIAAIPSVDLSDYYTKAEVDSSLDGVEASIQTEKNRIDAILDASQADKDTFAEIVQLINSVDTENDSAFASYVLSNNSAVGALDGRLDVIEPKVSTLEGNVASLDGRLDIVEPKVSTLESGLAQEILDRQSGDSALQAKLNASSYYHELHVNFDYTGVSDGSAYAPFKTIQAAVDAAAAPGRSGANTAIYLHPKINTSISENVTIGAAVNNLFIKALASGVDAAQIVINGQFKITGTSVRVRLEGFQISSPSGTPCLVIDGSNGAHSFINMDFSGGGGVQFINTWKSWHQFVDCGITGNLSLGGTPSAQSIVTLYRLRGFCTPVVSHANATLSVVEAYSLAGLTHSAGNVSLVRVTSPTANYNSTASFPSLFAMLDSSMQKTDLSFAKINKTGNGLFLLSNVSRDESTDVLSGTRINFGATIADAKYVPSVSGSWSASVISAKTALDEVMAKAKTVESGLASEITTARSAESALGARVTTLEGSITTKSYIDSQDSAKLVEAKAYTDAQIAAIPSVDLSGYYTKAEVDSSLDGVEASIAQEVLDRQSGDSSTLASAQAYADQKVADLVNSAPAALDTLNELAAALGDDANFSATVLGQISSVDSKVDQEILDRQSAISAEVLARDAADLSTLNDSKAYTDAQIAAIPPVDLSNYYTKAEVDSSLDVIESDIADLEAADLDLRSDVDDLEAADLDLRSDVDDLDDRVIALENAPAQSVTFDNYSVVVGAELAYIDLDRQVVKILSSANGRAAFHEGEDYTVSVVGGKTRLTWINSFANPDGEEKIETGDKLFFVYVY